MDIDRFVQDCVAANEGSDPQAAVLEVLARAVRSPRAVLAALGEPRQAGIAVLHRSKTLTIFNAAWTPQMNLMPHNHLMWANIGIYTGREDNLIWRKTPERPEAYGAKALFEGDVVALPVDVIHSVTNPAAAVHRRDPHLRRRLLRHHAQPVEPGNAGRRAIRRRGDPRDVPA